MKKMIFIIGFKNSIELNRSHFGDSHIFRKYEIAEDSHPIVISDSINENREENETHGTDKKLSSVQKSLKGVDFIVSQTVSPNLIKMAENSNIQPIIIKRKSEDEVLTAVQDNFLIILRLVENRDKKEKEKNILKL
ncbi:MAG: NifB/NifX family molybdenum-iron cluster-binding protein [bacterium]